jgi:hypothetical protein
MDNYKETLKYSYLNIAFKLLVIVAFVLFIIFYFKIDIFNLQFFKSTNHKDKKYVHKDYYVNRNLANAISTDKKLSDFYIKTAFNCCNVGYGTSNVERLKSIISEGFRCLDFKLIYKNNTLHIENQPQNETFYNALEIIDTHCFSNSYCHNNEDPLIINIRLDENITKVEKKLVYKKLREMFKTINSNKIDSTFSLLQKTNILKASLDDLNNKIIVMCNYDFTIVENDEIDAKHELLQYIHFNTYIPKNDANLDSSGMKTFLDAYNTNNKNNALISMQINENLKTDSINLINLNKEYPMMLIPNSYNNLGTVENPTSLEDIFGYTFRALEFSSTNDFSKEIMDPDMKLYVDEFNIANSAFILKPIKLRNNLIITQSEENILLEQVTDVLDNNANENSENIAKSIINKAKRFFRK